MYTDDYMATHVYLTNYTTHYVYTDFFFAILTLEINSKENSKVTNPLIGTHIIPLISQ